MQYRHWKLDSGVVGIRIGPDGDAPLLSVVVPFYDESPAPLVRDLVEQASALSESVEIVVADDGSWNRQLIKEVAAVLGGGVRRATLVISRRNNGRARIRNLLSRAACGQYLLYLDCDMRLGSADFLRRYLALCRAGAPDVAYGGFRVVSRGGYDPLPAFFANRSDCAPVRQRKADPARHTFTNNLLVRRALLRDVPFDERFVGWGWEDVEWALRAAERCTIEHIDNPVISPGSSSTAELLAKFRESAPNFDLLRRRHPQAAARYPVYRASRFASRVPLLARAGPMLARMARNETGLFPLPLRYYALKVYRACMYSVIFGARGVPSKLQSEREVAAGGVSVNRRAEGGTARPGRRHRGTADKARAEDEAREQCK